MKRNKLNKEGNILLPNVQAHPQPVPGEAGIMTVRSAGMKAVGCSAWLGVVVIWELDTSQTLATRDSCGPTAARLTSTHLLVG